MIVERNPYARPAVEDRPRFIDRILWAERTHPVVSRVATIVIGALVGVEASYQVALLVARTVAQHAIAPGP